MRIINLTPHPVTKGTNTYPAPENKGCIARVEEILHNDGTFSYGAPLNLPEPKEGTVLIVSLPVALGAPDRDDLRIAAGQLRDKSGRIVGCTEIAKLRMR